MVEHFTALVRSRDRHPKDLLEPILPDEIAERSRPQREVEDRLLFDRRRRDSAQVFAVAIGCGLAASLRRRGYRRTLARLSDFRQGLGLFVIFHRATPRVI